MLGLAQPREQVGQAFVDVVDVEGGDLRAHTLTSAPSRSNGISARPATRSRSTRYAPRAPCTAKATQGLGPSGDDPSRKQRDLIVLPSST